MADLTQEQVDELLGSPRERPSVQPLLRPDYADSVVRRVLAHPLILNGGHSSTYTISNDGYVPPDETRQETKEVALSYDEMIGLLTGGGDK